MINYLVLYLQYRINYLKQWVNFYMVRLAAAGRLRSAVALELAAGKVWALPKTVQIQLVGSSGATARATLNGLGATARAPVAASHHACGREELLRRWADSETRPQGSKAL